MTAQNDGTTVRQRARGSVLVVVIGVLAVLVLMATAFLSTTRVERSLGENRMVQAHLDIATRTALTYAMGELNKVTTDGYTALNQHWFLRFRGTEADYYPSILANSATDPRAEPYIYAWDANEGQEAQGMDLLGKVRRFSYTIGGDSDKSGDDKYTVHFGVAMYDTASFLALRDPGAAAGRTLLRNHALAASAMRGQLAADPGGSFQTMLAGKPLTYSHAQYLSAITAQYWDTYATPFYGALPSADHSLFGTVNIHTAPRILMHAITLNASNRTGASFSGLNNDLPEWLPAPFTMPSGDGIPGLDALQDSDGQGVGPLGDAAFLQCLYIDKNDTTGSTGVTFKSFAGTNGLKGDDYASDIMHALLGVLRPHSMYLYYVPQGGETLGPIDGYPSHSPATSVATLESSFMASLNAPTDILTMYNSTFRQTSYPWADGGTTYYTTEWLQDNPDGATATAMWQRSERMETAVNDVLNSYFNHDASPYHSPAEPGWYKVDMNGSTAIWQSYISTCESGVSKADLDAYTAKSLDELRGPAVVTADANYKTGGATNATSAADGWTPELAVTSRFFIVYTVAEVENDKGRIVGRRFSEALYDVQAGRIRYRRNFAGK